MRRVPELDSLRAFAAAIVLLFHIHPPTFFYGWAGVDLFFVLSGYLITAIILRHGQAGGFLPRFYGRRSLRIWPIYYIALIGLVLTNPYLPEPEPLDALPYYATYTQNIRLYWRNSTPPFHEAFNHTWTLALEEQFYLIWPALVLWAGRGRVVRLCLGTIGISYAARAGYLPFFGRLNERLLLARCDGFALGGLMAALMAETHRPLWQERWLRWGFTLAAVGGLAYLVGGTCWYGRGWLGLPTPAWPGLTVLAFGVLFFGVIGLIASTAGHPWLAPLRLASAGLSRTDQLRALPVPLHRILGHRRLPVPLRSALARLRAEAGGERRRGGAVVDADRAADPVAEGPAPLRERGAVGADPRATRCPCRHRGFDAATSPPSGPVSCASFQIGPYTSLSNGGQPVAYCPCSLCLERIRAVQ